MPMQVSPGILALRDVDWSRVHFFFCDERMVPYDNPESTFGVYQKLLFSKLNPSPVVHKVNIEAGSTEEVAKDYQADVLKYFGAENGYPAFDLLLLGIGPDGHTCSLFPRHELLRVNYLSLLILPSLFFVSTLCFLGKKSSWTSEYRLKSANVS